MSAAALRAEVLHASARRLRVRIPLLLRDNDRLTALAAAARNLPGVVAAASNPLTATLLLDHQSDTETLQAGLARELGLSFASSPGLSNVLPEVARGFRSQREAVRRETGVDLDPRTIAFYVLLMIALVQMIRGNVIVPATTALWYAMNLIPASDQPPASA